MSDKTRHPFDTPPPGSGETKTPEPGASEPTESVHTGSFSLARVADEAVAWLRTLASAAVYATLIVTFGFQVARVEGHSMAPTLADHDRLIVNKAAYMPWIGEPHLGDIVMLY